MKKIVESLIRLRNPDFSLDQHLGAWQLFLFTWVQVGSLARAWRLLLAYRSPKGMLRGKGVRFFHLAKIRWGKYVRLGDHVFISALGRQGVFLGDGVSIGAFSRVIVSTSPANPGSFIRLGHYVGIGEFAYLGGAGGLDIGNDCIIGQYFSCHPENHIFTDTGRLIRHQGVTRKGITIGPNCWIGSKVTILDGVEIGESCVIAAGSVVTKSVPPHSVVGGVPAVIKKTIV